jgi:alpha-tubulin suppressor-like RCC1 family protein
MSTRVRQWRTPFAVTVVALLFACLKGGAPTAADANDVRFDLAAQVTGGSTLHVVVVYLDQGTTSDVLVPVTLLDQRITAAPGTQSLPLTIDLTRCLADPRHVPPGPNCELFAAVTLLQNGSVIDSVSVGPVTVTPGQVVHANTSLTPIGHVDVYPPSATINVAATTQLYDTVFSPTDAILAGTSVTWTSRNPAVATVDTGGLVTGVGAGTTTVVASVGGQSDSATITVNAVSTGGAGITFPGLPGDSVGFSAPAGGAFTGAAGFVPVASTNDTVAVSNLVATITPSSATAWLVANVSDSGFGSRVAHGPPNGIRLQRIRKQTSGSGVVTPATVDVHPTTANLTAGTYSATVTVTGSGGASASFVVGYTITAPQPELAFSPNPMEFLQYAYGSTVAASASSDAVNNGTGALGQLSESGPITYSTTSDTGWLTVSSVNGTTVTVVPKTTSLRIGNDTANIPFTAVGALNNPQNLQVIVSSYVTYTKVVLGEAFGCGLTTASTVYCWGGDGQGELGDGGADLTVTIPVRANIPYSSTNPVIDIEAGSQHACAQQQSGAVYCWGANTRGQLGIGNTTSPVATPTLITGHTYQVISLGGVFSCGIEGTPANRFANYVDCWGDNTLGEFGNGTTSTTAQTTPVLAQYNSYYSISAGSRHMCAISSAAGYIDCWGNDADGQIGNGYISGNYTSPQLVSILLPSGGSDPMVSVSAGGVNTCAVDQSGNGYCWGDDSYGEVGNGTTGTQIPTPTLIAGYSWTSISVGAFSVCGIASTGDLCWGFNNYGQLGNGTTSNTGNGTPTPIIGSGQLLTQFTVGQSSQSACFITSATAYCMGLNGNGQLGNSDQINSTQASTIFGQPAPSGVTPSRVPARRPVTRAKN